MTLQQYGSRMVANRTGWRKGKISPQIFSELSLPPDGRARGASVSSPYDQHPLFPAIVRTVLMRLAMLTACLEVRSLPASDEPI
jgi:hypothetical protein